jgi:hypothetical protein
MLKIICICFERRPRLKFRVQAIVKFRQIFCADITGHHDKQVLLASFLGFVKQNIRKAVKHDTHLWGPHIVDRPVCC